MTAAYPAKLEGTSGHIVLEPRTDGLAQPQVTFVPLSGSNENLVFAIDDIVELKKVCLSTIPSYTSYGWANLEQAYVSMSRLALGWASGADVEGLGLTIRFKTMEQQIMADKEEGTTMEFTRVGRREQLFVRLISMGRQRWEVL